MVVTSVLLSFRVANHRSIREEQQLRLAPVYEADRPEGTVREAVPVAAIFGANAAGKSNVVDALQFMADMVRSSHRDAEPGGGIQHFPFALDPDGFDEPSWYVVDLLLDGVRHTYGFSIDNDQVLDEWLYSYPHGRKRMVFQRSGEDIAFGDSLPKRELELVKNITEANILFLSVAARSKQMAVLPVYFWFQDALAFRSGGRRARASVESLRLLRDRERAPAVVELLRAADLGIENVGVERAEAGDPYGTSVVIRRNKPQALPDQDSLFEAEAAAQKPTATRSAMRVWVEQRGRKGVMRLGLHEQSEGTRMLLEYAAPVLRTLDLGGTLVVDEVDSSLHPRLTAHLIRLFQDPATNRHGAQLLLTTHDASLLGRSGGEDILKRDQVWFVEKDEYGETALFPLSDFKPRQEENRERRYLGGSYGAVPFLSDERFEAAVAARGRASRDEGTKE